MNFILKIINIFLHRKYLIIISLCSFLISFVFSFVFTNAIHDKKIAEIVSYATFFLFSFFVSLLFLFLLFLLLKISLDRIKEKAGTIIQFKIIAIFFFSNTIIFIIICGLVIFILNSIFNLYLQREDIEELQNKKNNYVKIIQKEISKTEQKLHTVIDGEVNITKKNGISGIIFYKGNKIGYLLKAPWENKAPPANFSFLNAVKEKTFYSTYSAEGGYIYSIYKVKQQGVINSYIVYKYVPDFLKLNILENNLEINKIENITITKKYTLIISIILFIIIYFILFGLTITFFYFYSKNYFVSISEIITSSKKVAKGEYEIIISRSKKDEIKKLVDAFVLMTQKIKENQKKITRLADLEAWQRATIYLSHEIKNPLTPITLSIDYIKRKTIENSFEHYFQMESQFNLIHQKIDMIKNLLSDFSIITKPKEINKTTVLVKDFLKQFDDYLDLYKKIKSEINIFYEGNISIDIQKISQVINNLIKNSIESLEEKKNHKNPTIKISCYQKDKEIFITVCDNGIGIKKKQENIFQPYFTSKKKGMGLGLSICEKIMNEHGGRIFFTSDKKKTEFTIVFPKEENTE